MTGPTHPNLNLTPEEKRVFYQLFQAADTTNLGVVTGEVAVPFFEKTKLAPDTLGLVRSMLSRVAYARPTHPECRGLIFLLDTIDLANCRQRESRSPDAVRVQYRVEIDWTCASWSRTHG